MLWTKLKYLYLNVTTGRHHFAQRVVFGNFEKEIMRNIISPFTFSGWSCSWWYCIGSRFCDGAKACLAGIVYFIMKIICSARYVIFYVNLLCVLRDSLKWLAPLLKVFNNKTNLLHTNLLFININLYHLCSNSSTGNLIILTTFMNLFFVPKASLQYGWFINIKALRP